jgi:hypothetical protein
MDIKFKNSIQDVEALLEYNYLKSAWWKIYYMLLSLIGILTPITVIIYTIKSDPEFYLNIFILSFYILMTIVFTLFTIYLFFKFLPKLIIKRLKKIAYKQYKNKQIFSAEKIIELKDTYIEVTYNNNKLHIPLSKNSLIDEFKGNIFISSIFMKNKITKVYPVIIPITIFESNEIKEEFIKSIEEKKMLL